MGIIIKTAQEIAIMGEAGRIVAAVIAALTGALAPGITTRELDAIAVRELKRHGAAASFKGYRGFPASICVSVNDEVVHGIPGERLLQEGDIVGLDFGAYYRGFHGDAAVTVGVGNINLQSSNLLEVAEGALRAGIAAARQGARLGDISAAIQSHVESRGFSVVREYVGHGIGREMHEEPQIPNFGPPGQGPLLQNGMTLALEPMVNAGDWRTKVSANNWTVVTADGSLSAHFEHTIVIDGAEAKILTQL
jgi:methionyl aminopeptidase